jgi:hypothetical protein
MESWLIILITIGSGLIFFGTISYLKNRKNKRQLSGNGQPIVMFSNGVSNVIPTTNPSFSGRPRLLAGAPPSVQVYPIVHQQPQFYMQQQQFPPPNQHYQPNMIPNQQFMQPNQQFQPNMGQNRQYYNSTQLRVLSQPTAPAMM